MKGRPDLHAVRRILALLLVCTGVELRSLLSGVDTLKLQSSAKVSQQSPRKKINKKEQAL